MEINGHAFLANLKNAQQVATALVKPPVAQGWNRSAAFVPTFFNRGYLIYSTVINGGSWSGVTSSVDNVDNYKIYGARLQVGTVNIYNGESDGVLYITVRRLGDFINEIGADIITPFIPFYFNPSQTERVNSPWVACETPVNTLGNVTYSDLAENYLNGEYDDYYIVTSAKLFTGNVPRSEFRVNNLNTFVTPMTFYSWTTIQTNNMTITGSGNYAMSNGIHLYTLSAWTPQSNSFPGNCFNACDFMTVTTPPTEEGIWTGNGIEINTPYKTLLIGKYNDDFNRGIRIGSRKVSCDFRYKTTMFCSLEWNTTRVAYLACAFPTIDDIIKYYNDWGIRASTNLDDVINNGDVDPEYIAPGVPDTPPDIQSFPDNSSDPVTFPTVNITAATLAGCMVYDYTKAKSVLDWLRSNTFFQDINRLFNNPIDAIYSFLLYPFDIVAHDTTHVTESPTTSILNVSTDISTYLIDGGYNFTLNGGEYYYTPYYGNFADYAFVDYSIYIPFFGIAPLSPDDVVGHLLAVKYAFDISSGACTIFLTSDGQLLRILNGSLAQAIPIISSNNNERILNLTLSALGAVGGIGKGIAESVATQNPLPALTSVGDAVMDVGKTAINNPYRQAISGRLGVDTAFYAPYNCYLIINNHYYSPAAAQNPQMGTPSNYSVTLNDLTGYFSVKSVNLVSTTATKQEIEIIKTLLISGVYRS